MSFDPRETAYMHRKIAVLSRDEPNGSIAVPRVHRTCGINDKKRDPKAPDCSFERADIPIRESTGA